VTYRAAWRVEHRASVEEARRHLSEQDFAIAWAQGRAMTLEQAVADALEPNGD
jgi:hypothetical protein